MGARQHSHDDGTATGCLPRRTRLECRECGIVCEQVVSPWHCLKSGCTYVYAFESDGTTYFGCLYKVFSPELDLAAFQERKSRVGSGTDPYGPLRATRMPRPQCRTWIERAYEAVCAGLKCCNPGFLYGSTPHD